MIKKTLLVLDLRVVPLEFSWSSYHIFVCITAHTRFLARTTVKMVFLLLAPYNDSMTLGQGFNSFLHMPRLDGAVEIPESSLHTQAVRAGGATNVSQVVSYSSRFVEKISEVVRSMNISAASSIKSGTIEVSGNSLSVDEAKFAASDLNAVISVKVINQTTTTIKNPKL